MRAGLLAGVALAGLTLATSAAAQAARTVLPVPDAPFTGVIGETLADSRPGAPSTSISAPAGAPNVLVVMADDVGFSMSSAFGGPVPTPNMDRLAASGQRYNRFHTTAICSPSRAALLTGRNAHNVGYGALNAMATDFPGYNARIPQSAATIAQTLRLNGYSTAMFGKHHNVPPGEDGPDGPFDSWPTGLGFEYFFGFIDGEADQWRPRLYRGTNLLPDADGETELLDHRLASDAITWIHNQKAAGPDKPFFIYLAPGSAHAPHQAPADYIARFKGKFDQGWDKVREETYRRQLASGVIPKGTKLTARPAEIPAWESLTPSQKPYAVRSMEVIAAMLAYQDAELGRVLDELDRMGQLANTLVVVVQGDNGASGEVGPRGSVNEYGRLTNRIEEDDAWLAANVDKLGGPLTAESYPVGWAWAMNTPFRWVKQYASTLGGIRNGMIMAWPGHVARPNSICAEFSHLVDIAPTVLEAAKVPAPERVYGVKQKPLDGQSLLPSLSSCHVDRPRTQYFEMIGKIGFYQDGWFLSADDGRTPWQETTPPALDPKALKWSLYDLRSDFSQSDDLAQSRPGKVKSMAESWRQVARANNVFPLDNRMGARGRARGPLRKQYDYWGADVSIPARSGPLFAGRTFTLTADIDLASDNASGAIMAVGSRFGGWSFYLVDGRPAFTYALSARPQDTTTVIAERRLARGAGQLRMKFAGEGLRKGATVQLLQSDSVLAEGRIPSTFIVPGGAGETLDIGRDTAVPVTDYKTRGGALEGEVRHVGLTFQDTVEPATTPR